MRRSEWLKARKIRAVLVLLSVVSLLCCTMSKVPPGKPATLTIHALDVGYGESFLIMAPDHSAILIDGGFAEKGPEVRDYLVGQGVRALDLVVNTHPHPDHIGGLTTVLEVFPVKEVWGSHELSFSLIPEEFRSVLDRKKIPYRPVRRGHVWQWQDSIGVSVLHPGKLVEDLNDCSLVLTLAFHQHSLLFCGDIGPEAQKELLSVVSGALPALFMNIPHHGGRSHLPFFSAVSPLMAVLSVGPNPWGNPKAETLQYLEDQGIYYFRTDRQGTLVFSVSPVGEVNLAGTAGSR